MSAASPESCCNYQSNRKPAPFTVAVLSPALNRAREQAAPQMLTKIAGQSILESGGALDPGAFGSSR